MCILTISTDDEEALSEFYDLVLLKYGHDVLNECYEATIALPLGTKFSPSRVINEALCAVQMLESALLSVLR